MKKVEIVDVTLRDGEQTNGVAFSAKDKLQITKLLLEELKVDRVEVASARISEGEFKAVQNIVEWAGPAGYLDKIAILGFVDQYKSIDWIVSAGAKVMNLLCKGSYKHVTQQLRKTPEEHLAEIIDNIAYATEKGIAVNVYLEDWSNGMGQSPDYIFFMMDSLQHQPIKNFMMPDTLGILNPAKASEYCKAMVARYPKLRFDFHGHNDYDVSVANSLAAIEAGFTGVHGAVNGLGEKAGNTPLSSMVIALKDFTDKKIGVDETRLINTSKIVALLSGMRIPENKPVIGENVFTQNCGVHADGDSKGNLYFNDLLPERFNGKRKYSLGKTSGKANVKQNLKELGIKVEDSVIEELLKRIVKLGDKKELITIDDLPFLVSDILNNNSKESQQISLKKYYLHHKFMENPEVHMTLEVFGKEYADSAEGDGQYDAFLKCCRKIFTKLDMTFPKLYNYQVEIPQGGKSDALVKTTITWEGTERNFKTKGLDTDQFQSSINATLNMLNQIFANSESK